ncbi:gliding motility lipoprotein GldD [Apibacter muscae]|uniref:Gliding motility lipoprotein GldD n=1 Tax=Apibacter muscae TaxID=2509004 RepID=A0A563D962_9FLAO|nr:gliding motility lipoprotein GldD [Apibacter muscae]TWP26730.1 gliding motility lipoprotein GldD [Apibacter muscae]
MFLSKNIKFNLVVLFAIVFVLNGCKDHDYIPKPIGQVRLEYPNPKYKLFSPPHCPFEFEYSDLLVIKDRKEPCWFNFYYPNMKATVYITYSSVNNDLNSLIKEAQRLVYEHTIKANSINTKSFIYPEKKVYGNLYKIGGESASNIQFYVTDSIHNFISGNLYFRVQPKPDSLSPAIDYVERDIIKMIETTTWK